MITNFNDLLRNKISTKLSNKEEFEIIEYFYSFTEEEQSNILRLALADFYNFKLFLTVKEKEQLERIKRRSGKDKLQAYINKWIPLEEEYFSTLKIEEGCDLIVDTTSEK